MAEPTKTTSITIPMSLYDFICEAAARNDRSRNWMMSTMLMAAKEQMEANRGNR